MSEKKCPEFFKVYIPSLSSQRLRIPPAFVKNFKGTMPKKVILKDFTGKLWHVELKKVEKKLFMHNGWQDFVTDYSLEYGDFLIFSYSQNSIFNVRLFGKDGCRKESDSAIVKIATHVKEEEDPEAVRTDSRFPRACKRKSSLALRAQTIEPPYVRQCKARMAAINVEKHKVLDAENFVVPKNPHFVAVISICNRYDVHIPSTVLKKYGINMNPDIVLRDQSGKAWPMKVTFRNDGRSAFTAGWSDFRKHMKLQLRDKCVFEFILEKGPEKGKICKEVRLQVFPARPINQENFTCGTSRQMR